MPDHSPHFESIDSGGCPVAEPDTVFGHDDPELKGMRKVEVSYRILFETMSSGFALHEAITHADGSLADYRFLDVNSAFERLTGLKKSMVIGRTARECFSGLSDRWFELYDEVLRGEHERLEFNEYSGTLNRHFHVVAYRTEPGRFAVIFEDITQQLRDAIDVRISEQKYKALFECLQQGVVCQNESATIIECNDAACAILGLTRDQLLGKDSYDPEWRAIDLDGGAFPPDMMPAVRAIRSRKAVGPVVFGVHRPGQRDPRWIEVNSYPQFDIPGDSLLVITIFSDITARITAESELRYLDMLLNQAHKVTHDGVLVLNEKQQSVFMNKRFMDIWNIDGEWLKIPDPHKRLMILSKCLKNPEMFAADVIRLMADHHAIEVGYRVEFLNGKIYERHSVGMFDRGDYRGRLLNYRDITEKVEAEERIRRSLNEKVVLLREVHHRVKNNLQIISSLLSLQISDDPRRFADAVAKTQHRIRSMALVHDMLYKSQDFSDIDAAEYFTALTDQTASAYGAEKRNIRVDIQAEHLHIDMERIVPCGLIVNELVINAFKYAFPQGQPGVIIVRLRRTAADDVEITVRDNGIGLPYNFRIDSEDSLGMRLVSGLTAQIEGRLMVEGDPGACFVLTFPG